MVMGMIMGTVMGMGIGVLYSVLGYGGLPFHLFLISISPSHLFINKKKIK